MILELLGKCGLEVHIGGATLLSNTASYRITEDSAVTTFEALKARVRELERQLSRGDRYKCLICMVSRRKTRGALGQALVPPGGLERVCPVSGLSEGGPASVTPLPTSSLGFILNAPNVNPVLARALRGVLAANPGKVAWRLGSGWLAVLGIAQMSMSVLVSAWGKQERVEHRT